MKIKTKFLRYQTYIIVGLAGCLLAAAMSFGVTSAWMFSRAEESNAFLIGGVAHALHNNFQPPEALAPGDDVPMAVRVENTGNLPIFVRVRVDFSSQEAEEACEPLAIDQDSWSAGSDGYYYCKAMLLPGESTAELLREVTIKADATLASLGGFDLIVYAETVQHMDHSGAHTPDEWESAWA
jgi:hypothetical protein